MAPRVVILTNMLPPYRMAFFSELAKRCDLLVVADTAIEANRQWKADAQELPFAVQIAGGWAVPFDRKRSDLGYTERRYLQLANKTIPILRRFDPQAVISAEMGLRTVQAEIFCRAARRPLILWWEGTRHTEREEPAIKRALRRRLIRRARRFWSNGSASSEYLEDLGASRAAIDEGMTGVDVSQYVQRGSVLMGMRDAKRRELGLEGPVLLFVGALSGRKGIRQLLKALGEAAKDLPRCSVLFVGDGDLRPEIEVFAASHPKLRVVVTGFVEPSDIFPYYAAGDVFVLPTLDDNWPLVTLEAAVSGLPQVFSCYNGAAADLCRSERSGRIVDPRNTAEFARNLADVIKNPPARLSPKEVESVAAYYSPQSQADRAIASIGKAL